MSLMRNFALLLMMVPGITGCISTLTAPFASAPVDSEKESFAEYNDVPYPVHFKFISGESFTYSRRGVRAGVIAVAGRMTIDELGAYYDQHLPGYGWEPVAEAQSEVLLSTWKKAERILTIIARPGSMPFTTELKVELWVAPPHTKDDLGRRVIYKSPGAPENATPSGGGVIEENL